MKDLLRIEAREPLGEGQQYMTARNVKVMIGDKELGGIERLTIHYQPDDIVRADVVMCMVDGTIIGANPEFFLAHPETGELQRVKRIEFYDCEPLEC